MNLTAHNLLLLISFIETMINGKLENTSVSRIIRSIILF